MNQKEKLGCICKYHRVKHNFPLKSYLHDNSSTICSYTLYKKVVSGKSNTDKVYVDIYRANKLAFIEDPNAELYFKELSKKIKDCIENFEYDELKALLDSVDVRNYNHYPYLFYYDVLDFIYCMFVEFGTYKRNIITHMKDCIEILPKDLNLCFWYSDYANIHRVSMGAHSIAKEMKPILDKEEDDIIVLLIKSRVFKTNNMSVEAIACLDKILEKEKTKEMFNLQVMCLQDYHACYYALSDYEKSNYYFEELISLIETRQDKMSEFSKCASYHYLAMQYFLLHDFEKSYKYLVLSIEGSVRCTFTVWLVYMHVCSTLGEEVNWERFEEEVAIGATDKLMLRYFKLYFNGTNKKRLFDFIGKRLLVVIGEENSFEYHILLEQLLMLGYLEEFKELFGRYKTLDYYLFDEWMDRLNQIK